MFKIWFQFFNFDFKSTFRLKLLYYFNIFHIQNKICVGRTTLFGRILTWSCLKKWRLVTTINKIGRHQTKLKKWGGTLIFHISSFTRHLSFLRLCFWKGVVKVGSEILCVDKKCFFIIYYLLSKRNLSS